eukprot:scaffold27140_cov120-Isochrysis_galbana.AAC.3
MPELQHRHQGSPPQCEELQIGWDKAVRRDQLLFEDAGTPDAGVAGLPEAGGVIELKEARTVFPEKLGQGCASRRIVGRWRCSPFPTVCVPYDSSVLAAVPMATGSTPAILHKYSHLGAVRRLHDKLRRKAGQHLTVDLIRHVNCPVQSGDPE